TPFRRLYLDYLMRGLPVLAHRVSSNPDAYAYLAESIRSWPGQLQLARQIAATGWVDVHWRNLTGGIGALHRAERPRGLIRRNVPLGRAPTRRTLRATPRLRRGPRRGRRALRASAHRVPQGRQPVAGVGGLQLRDPPVVAGDHLPAPVAAAVAAQQELGVGDAGGVVTGQLLAGGDVAAGAKRQGIGPPHAGLAGVVERAQLRARRWRGRKSEHRGTRGNGRRGEQAPPGDRRRAGGYGAQGQQLNVPLTLSPPALPPDFPPPRSSPRLPVRRPAWRLS